MHSVQSAKAWLEQVLHPGTHDSIVVVVTGGSAVFVTENLKYPQNGVVHEAAAVSAGEHSKQLVMQLP